MEAIAHLPGCDLRHTRRQRCSSWPPPAPAPADEFGAQSPAKEPAARLGVAPFLLFSSLMWVPLVLLLTAAMAAVNAVALDRLGWVDIGYPNFIREVKPSGVALVADAMECGSGNHALCQTTFLYGTDVPFDEIRAHYIREMTSRGYAYGERSYFGQPAVWFDRPGSTLGRAYELCFGISEFGWDAVQSFPAAFPAAWSSGLVSKPINDEDLRSRLTDYKYAYVARYADDCGA